MPRHHLKLLAPVVPYITIGPGLLVFHNAWIALIGYHLCMIGVILSSREPIRLDKLWQSSNRVAPVIATVIASGAGITLYFLWSRLGVPADINIYLRNIGLYQDTWPWFLLYFILVNPWIEEYYWRGYLGSESKFIVLNDLFFAGYHLVVLAGKIGSLWLLIVFAALFLGAWFWRQSNRISQGLLPSLASHMAADLAVMFAIYRLTE